MIVPILFGFTLGLIVGTIIGVILTAIVSVKPDTNSYKELQRLINLGIITDADTAKRVYPALEEEINDIFVSTNNS